MENLEPSFLRQLANLASIAYKKQSHTLLHSIRADFESGVPQLRRMIAHSIHKDIEAILGM